VRKYTGQAAIIILKHRARATRWAKRFREALQKAELPAAQGRVAIFNDCKLLKMKESKNHIFCSPYAEKSRKDLFRVSLDLAAACGNERRVRSSA
jgi:hypothetical protein